MSNLFLIYYNTATFETVTTSNVREFYQQAMPSLLVGGIAPPPAACAAVRSPRRRRGARGGTGGRFASICHFSVISPETPENP